MPTPARTLRPGQRYAIRYRTRPLGTDGQDTETGTIDGWWTGKVDTWGKYTLVDTRGPMLYLFADEIVSVEPLDVSAESAQPLRRDSRLDQSWHLRDANGRLPAVRKVGQGHEAPIYLATVGCGDPLLGPIVARLDFGYGYDKAEMAQVARLMAAAPDLLAELRRLERWMAQSGILCDQPRHQRVRALLARIDGQEEG